MAKQKLVKPPATKEDLLVFTRDFDRKFKYLQVKTKAEWLHYIQEFKKEVNYALTLARMKDRAGGNKEVRLMLDATINRARVVLKSELKKEIREEMQLLLNQYTEIVKEEVRAEKMEILGAVSDFGKRTDDLEVGSNFLTARVEEHEERLTKIESKITGPTS